MGDDRSTVNKPSSIIDWQMEDMLARYEREVSKGGHANHEAMYDMARCVVVYNSHLMVVQDSEHSRKLALKIDAIVIDIRKTYNNKWTITLTAISAIVTVGAGGCGLLPLTGARIFSSTVVDTLAKASVQLSPAGQSIKGFGDLFEQSEQGKRGELQANMEKLKEKQQSSSSHKSENNQRKQKDMEKRSEQEGRRTESRAHATNTR